MSKWCAGSSGHAEVHCEEGKEEAELRVGREHLHSSQGGYRKLALQQVLSYTQARCKWLLSRPLFADLAAASRLWRAQDSSPQHHIAPFFLFVVVAESRFPHSDVGRVSTTAMAHRYRALHRAAPSFNLPPTKPHAAGTLLVALRDDLQKKKVLRHFPPTPLSRSTPLPRLCCGFCGGTRGGAAAGEATIDRLVLLHFAPVPHSPVISEAPRRALFA